MRLTRYGMEVWLVVSLVAIMAVVAGIITRSWWSLPIVGVAWACALAFFRDPRRHAPANLPAGAMLAPADGRISAIERLSHHPAMEGEAVLIRIFLSILDVHVNRSPCDGQVVSIDHRPGRHRDARRPSSSKVNESTMLVLRRDGGSLVGIRQVAGAIARRIVCEPRVGDRLARGGAYGMIRFGSTTELILPGSDDVDVRVSEGERVRAGLTVLATVPKA